MEIVTIVVLVAGVLVTLLASLVKNVSWSYKHKATVATVLSVVAGVGAAFVGVPLAELGSVASNLPQFIMSVYGTSQLMYTFILKGTTLEKTLAEVGHTPEVVSDELPMPNGGYLRTDGTARFEQGTRITGGNIQSGTTESPDESSQ